MYESATVLQLGARGDGFTLVGRRCVEGRRGANWNEWSARFDDGRTRFLVESGDGFVLYDEGSLVPELDALVVGRPVDTGYFVVARGEAKRVAAWGEVESAPRTYAHVDLARADGTCATLDFGESPRLFVGRRTTLAELGLTPSACRSFVPAPDVSRPIGVEPWFDPGDEGELDGIRFVVLGMVSRMTDDEAWDEYALFDPSEGLRWLVLTRGRFRIARAVPVTDPSHGPGAAARVVWAMGELPWAVSIGDASFVEETGDLAKEWTEGELSWTRSVPIPTDTIAKCFGKRSLPKPQ